VIKLMVNSKHNHHSHFKISFENTLIRCQIWRPSSLLLVNNLLLTISLSIFCATSASVMAQELGVMSENRCKAKIDDFTYYWEFQEAIKTCNACLSKHPSSALLHFSRGYVNLCLNNRRAAALDFKKAAELGFTSKVQDELELMRIVYDTAYAVQMITDSLEFQKLVPELGFKARITRADTLRGMLRPERTCMDVTYQKLTVKVIPELKEIDGNNEIHFLATAPSKSIQLDLYDQYNISRITVNGKDVSYSRESHAIFIILEDMLEKGRSYVISVSYNGKPIIARNPPWQGGFTWGKNGDRHHIGVSCEHLGASSWYPNKDHLSDKVDSMDINIQAPKDYDVIANGNLLGTKDCGDGYTEFQWHVSYPINSYNVTFYVGDFENFHESYKSSNGKKVAIDYYVLKENIEKAKVYYNKTQRVIKTFEKLFGPYAFTKDGFGFVESPFAGMEHQSAIAIGGNYGQDSSYPIFKGYDYLVVHEAAHEWWGNAVAIGDMADVWINEGFATYSEHLFSEIEFGEKKYILDVADNMFSISNIWPMVGEPDVNDNAFLGQDVYYKGAAMLHSLRCVFNDDKAFFKMIKAFYEKSAMKISKSEDFTIHAQHYTKRDLRDFFAVYMHQNSPPVLEYSYHLNESGKLRLRYKWTNVGPQFNMPFLLCTNHKKGHRIEATTTMSEIEIGGVKNFYLPHALIFDESIKTLNSLTYFHANMVSE